MRSLLLSPLFAAAASAALMLSIGLAPSSAETVDPVVYSPLSPSAPSRDPLVDSPPPVSAVPSDPYAVYVAEAALRFGVPESWIRAVLRVESAGDPAATSPKSAMGLMQVMPQTWAELSARYGFGPNAYDPRESILAGAAYLREMHERYGTIEGMLAAYNAGPGRYDDHLATGRPLPWETQHYVAMIAPAIGDTALPLPTGRRVVRVFDPLAAPLFVAPAADRPERPVQAGAVPAAALTPDEARLVAVQSATPNSPDARSDRQPAAASSAARVQPERTRSAGGLQRSSDTGGLFVPRSRPEPR